MQKRFAVGLGGRVKVFASKRGYLWWAVSTRDGWKHLVMLPVLALVWLRVRKDLEKMRE